MTELKPERLPLGYSPAFELLLRWAEARGIIIEPKKEKESERDGKQC